MMQSRANLEAQIIERAIKDEDFRNELKKNPKKTVEDAIGVKLPDALSVHVTQEGPNDIYISLPEIKKGLPEGELTGEELEGVSGGWGGGNATKSSG